METRPCELDSPGDETFVADSPAREGADKQQGRSGPGDVSRILERSKTLKA
jgi:hypothetical protein